MRMAKDHGIDFVYRNRKRVPVTFFLGPTSLDQAAFEQYRMLPGTNHVQGSRYLLGSAEKLKLEIHGFPLWRGQAIKSYKWSPYSIGTIPRCVSATQDL